MDKQFEVTEGQDLLQTLGSEIARAERAKEDLSVILLRIRTTERAGGVSRRIGHQVVRSIRMSDTACWYDRHHVALLLPGTTADGAQNVLRRIQTNAAGSALSPETRIVQYPQTTDVLGTIHEFIRF